MKTIKDNLLGFVLGIVFFGSMLLVMGAVNKDTVNVDSRLGSQYPLLNVACSADGSHVYVGAYDRIYHSKNFGKDWNVVLSDERVKKY